MSIVPKIFEKKIKEYPTLQLTNVNTTQVPRYKERESPVMHVRAWPHLFPSTLADLPNKWYKMEEARGETFLWHEIREIFY